MRKLAALLIMVSSNLMAAAPSSSTAPPPPIVPPSSAPSRLPPFRDVKELEKCMSVAEAKTLLDGMVRRIVERTMLATADLQRQAKNLSTQILGAESEYQACMKREKADLSVQSKEKPLPCVEEREAYFESRRRYMREGPSTKQDEINARIEPIYLEEVTAMEAEFSRRCAQRKSE